MTSRTARRSSSEPICPVTNSRPSRSSSTAGSPASFLSSRSRSTLFLSCLQAPAPLCRYCLPGVATGRVGNAACDGQRTLLAPATRVESHQRVSLADGGRPAVGAGAAQVAVPYLKRTGLHGFSPNCRSFADVAGLRPGSSACPGPDLTLHRRAASVKDQRTTTVVPKDTSSADRRDSGGRGQTLSNPFLALSTILSTRQARRVTHLLASPCFSKSTQVLRLYAYSLRQCPCASCLLSSQERAF